MLTSHDGVHAIVTRRRERLRMAVIKSGAK